MRIRPVSSNIPRRIDRLRRALPELVDKAHSHFQSITPIDTGNARRNTRKQQNGIVADYDYAVRLNTGYSRQAPDGMTDPTIDYIRNEIRKL